MLVFSSLVFDGATVSSTFFKPSNIARTVFCSQTAKICREHRKRDGLCDCDSDSKCFLFCDDCKTKNRNGYLSVDLARTTLVELSVPERIPPVRYRFVFFFLKGGGGDMDENYRLWIRSNS